MMLWLKALHILAVISWMAGMLYLPRLFIYHTEAGLKSPQAGTFTIMEERLLRIIMRPAMIVVWVTGPLLGWQMGYLKDGWFWGKMAAVLALTGAHIAMVGWQRALADGSSNKTSKYFRIANEVPTVLMIAIVVLVVVKPF